MELEVEFQRACNEEKGFLLFTKEVRPLEKGFSSFFLFPQISFTPETDGQKRFARMRVI